MDRWLDRECGQGGRKRERHSGNEKSNSGRGGVRRGENERKDIKCGTIKGSWGMNKQNRSGG